MSEKNRELKYGVLEEKEIHALQSMIEQSHCMPLERQRQVVYPNLERENFRQVSLDNKVVSTLATIPMGQWFHGNNIPLIGIDVVTVPAEYRGKGVAKWMMKQVLLEFHEKGYVLSGLFPTTSPLYKSVGYERAGTRITYDIDPQKITVGDRTLDLVPVYENDLSELKKFYHNEWAPKNSGLLDRAPLLWKRLYAPPVAHKKIYSYLIKNSAKGGAIEGYVVLMQGKPLEDPLTVLDYGAMTPTAAKRILTLLSDHSSMIKNVEWFGGPSDSLVAQLAEQNYQIKHIIDWMIRILDVKKALELKHYPKHLSGEWSILVKDDLIQDNNGSFNLHLDKGKMKVTPGGNGRIELTIQELTSLYTSFSSPFDLTLKGSAINKLSRDELDELELLFAGPKPWTPEIY